ncbi:LysM peptidoglycan-binding domain-containing protein [Frigoribacterium sp. Leaf263]|uniref:LysM peptidoglycan-binding domain-containing protein n=1 Tax=Frigoribacterium sp. Leaf263 TaxID=1736313 RepID=UPI0009E9E707|nr:LysM peptidoglycan-binding domain-containing protein [Frigoribacterium sp. Leaf263]
MSATTISRNATSSNAPIGATPRVRLRITRRGRRVVGAGVTLLVAGVVGGVLLAGPGAQASDTAGSASFEYVTVDGGDTLWQVASEIAPTKDPRDVISDIVRLNNLGSTEVAVGQSLAVPAQYSN